MIANKYDAERKACEVIASCTTIDQIRVAVKFAIRAFRLRYPGDDRISLWDAQISLDYRYLMDARGVSREGLSLLHDLISDQIREIRENDPGYQKRREAEKAAHYEQWVRASEQRLWAEYEASKKAPKVSVNVDVKVSV
jgi:hypothetical protein